MTPARRAGFSFVEALVVLAITSTLLVLLTSVSTGGVRAGFRTAARADAAQERLAGQEALRSLVRAVRLPGRGRLATPFQGDADGFVAAIAPTRPTPCTTGAPAPALSLRLDRSGGRTRLLCAGAGGRAAVLLDLGDRPAAFTYALAGRPWSKRLDVEPPPERPSVSQAAAPPPRLWIRLAAPEGSEVVEEVDPPATPRSVQAGA